MAPSLEDTCSAVRRTYALLRRLRATLDIDLASALNLFLSNGHYLVATRFVLNFGCYSETLLPSQLVYHSLWYSHGRSYGTFDGEFRTDGGSQSTRSVIVSSEPLTRDISTWVEVPEYSLLAVEPRPDGEHDIHLSDIDE